MNKANKTNKTNKMSEKFLINFDFDVLSNMIRRAFSLNPNFSRRPSYIIRPDEDHTWTIVGLHDTNGGPNYYPSTACPTCGEIKAMGAVANEEKQLYEISCNHCGSFCNYFAIYNPRPEVIDKVVELALAVEHESKITEQVTTSGYKKPVYE